MSKQPFWQTKKLSEFSDDEWESICYHCGRCCLIKLQDDETDNIYYTHIICRYFNKQTHLCSKYKDRRTIVPTCLKLTPKNIDSIFWVPKLCAYRILKETGDLPQGHPLKKSNISIPSLPKKLIYDNLVSEEDLEDFIIENEDF